MPPRTNRIRVTEPTIKTREQAESCLAEIRELTIQRNQLQLRLETERKALDDQYGPDIQEADTRINGLSELLRGWAEANLAEFGKRRSLELIHGELGWRVGMPKLVKRAKLTWEAMVDKVKSILGHAYIRSKDEVDRATIIRAHEDGVIDAAQLRQCGLEVSQDDTFFVTPRIDDVTNRVTSQEAA